MYSKPTLPMCCLDSWTSSLTIYPFQMHGKLANYRGERTEGVPRNFMEVIPLKRVANAKP